MRINKIRLKGIGSHKDTTIELTEPITAISGNNGMGKTFLIEATPACLFGIFPTRSGSIYDRMTSGMVGEAKIEVEFDMDGIAYKAWRHLKKTGKTTSSEGYLFKAGQERCIAGGKISDYDNAIENLVGTPHTFLASVFSSQKNDGDICDAKPAERKAVLAKLLGLEHLEATSKAAKEKAKGIEASIEAEQSTLWLLQGQSAGIEDLKALQAKDEAEKSIQDNLIEKQKGNIDTAISMLKEKEIKGEKIKGIKAQIESMNNDIITLEADIAKDRAEYARLKEISAKTVDIEQLNRDIEQTEKALETVKHNLEKLQESKELIDAENMEIDKFNNERESVIREAATLVTIAKNNLAAAQKEYESTNEQAKLIDETPNQECCKSCKLLAGAIEANNRLIELGNVLGQATQAVEDRHQFLKDTEATPKKSRKDTGKLQADIIEAKKTMNGYESSLKEYRRILSTADQAKEAQGSMKTLAESGIKQKAIIEEKKKSRDEVVKQLDGYAGLENEIIKHTAEVSEAKRVLALLESGLSTIISRIASAEERIKQAQEAKNKSNEIASGIWAKTQQAQDYRAIEEAFGKNGIQPLIIAEATPEIQQIANEMLSEVTAGQMSVRFDTLKELKSGEMAESLEIIISRAGHELEIGEFSGGEQKIIRLVIRLALAVYQARKGGSRLKTLFIDELFENLDGDNSDKLLKMLISLTKQFDRVVIISHDDAMLSDIPCRLNLIKSGGNTKVEVVK